MATEMDRSESSIPGVADHWWNMAEFHRRAAAALEAEQAAEYASPAAGGDA